MPRTNLYQKRNVANFDNLTITPDTRAAQLLNDIITAIDPASQAVRRRNAQWRPISLPFRSGVVHLCLSDLNCKPL
jgi:hypothetical protein